MECSLIRTQLHQVVRKLNEEGNLLSPKENEITPCWEDMASAESRVELLADGKEDNKTMEIEDSVDPEFLRKWKHERAKVKDFYAPNLKW